MLLAALFGASYPRLVMAEGRVNISYLGVIQVFINIYYYSAVRYLSFSKTLIYPLINIGERRFKMKFHFNFQVKGMSKSDKEGVKKIWEGMDCQIEAEAEISELIEIMKDKQISADKLINFIKQDLPQSIKDCGSALISVEKQNRQMNLECPSKGMRDLIKENESLKKENNSLYSDLHQEEDKSFDLVQNLTAERTRNKELKEALEKKELQFQSLKADMEGTCQALHALRREHDELKAKWNEENTNDRDNAMTDAMTTDNRGIRTRF